MDNLHFDPAKMAEFVVAGGGEAVQEGAAETKKLTKKGVDQVKDLVIKGDGKSENATQLAKPTGEKVPTLPVPGNAPAPYFGKEGSGGNPWTAANWFIGFLEAMLEFAKESKGMKALEGQEKVKGLERTWSLGKTEAETIREKGRMEALQHFLQAAVAFGTAAAMGAGTVKAAKNSIRGNKKIQANKQKIQENESKLSADTNLKASKNDLAAKKADIKAKGDAHGPQSAEAKQARANYEKAKSDHDKEYGNQKELTEKQVQDLKTDNKKLERKNHEIQSRIEQDNTNLRVTNELISQLSKAFDHLIEGCFKIVISELDYLAAIHRTEQDINKQMLQSAGEHIRDLVQLLGEIVNMLNSVAKSRSDTFRFTPN